MSDQFLAEIRVFPFNFAPVGWALCNGQLLSISQATALFSLLGTTYGGDGISNFALPNLQGQLPLHAGGGSGPGLSPYTLGQTGGSAAVALLSQNLPQHNHQLMASTSAANSNSIAQAMPAVGGWKVDTSSGPVQSYSTAAPNAAISQGLSPSGSGLPHNNLMPYLTLNFCIAMQGIFPPRS